MSDSRILHFVAHRRCRTPAAAGGAHHRRPVAAAPRCPRSVHAALVSGREMHLQPRPPWCRQAWTSSCSGGRAGLSLSLPCVSGFIRQSLSKYRESYSKHYGFYVVLRNCPLKAWGSNEQICLKEGGGGTFFFPLPVSSSLIPFSLKCRTELWRAACGSPVVLLVCERCGASAFCFLSLYINLSYVDRLPSLCWGSGSFPAEALVFRERCYRTALKWALTKLLFGEVKTSLSDMKIYCFIYFETVSLGLPLLIFNWAQWSC